MDEHGGEWKGKAFMCTRDREFRIIGREDCFVRGFDRTGFFEVDTGKEAKNWTVQSARRSIWRPLFAMMPALAAWVIEANMAVWFSRSFIVFGIFRKT